MEQKKTKTTESTGRNYTLLGKLCVKKLTDVPSIPSVGGSSANDDALLAKFVGFSANSETPATIVRERQSTLGNLQQLSEKRRPMPANLQQQPQERQPTPGNLQQLSEKRQPTLNNLQQLSKVRQPTPDNLRQLSEVSLQTLRNLQQVPKERQ